MSCIYLPHNALLNHYMQEPGGRSSAVTTKKAVSYSCEDTSVYDLLYHTVQGQDEIQLDPIQRENLTIPIAAVPNSW